MLNLCAACTFLIYVSQRVTPYLFVCRSKRNC